MKKTVLFILLSLVCAAGTLAEEVYAEEYGYFLDIPGNWVLLDAQDLARITFSDPTGNAFLKVISHPGDKYSSAAEISEDVMAQLGAQGDKVEYEYFKTDSVFADLSFTADDNVFRGYFLFINTDETDFILFAISSAEYYEYFQVYLLSALDSFSINEKARYYANKDLVKTVNIIKGWVSESQEEEEE